MLLALGGSAFGAFYFLGFGARSEIYTGPSHVVRYELLELTIVEKGALESAVNSEIICRVKSGTRGGSSSIIKNIIDDGTYVKETDWLISLDDSALQDQLRDQNIKVDEALAKKLTAQTNLKVAQIEFESAIETAVNLIELAEIELFKYVGAPTVTAPLAASFVATFVNPIEPGPYSAASLVVARHNPPALQEGEYQQALQEIKGRIGIAQSDREMWLDRSAWSQNMVKKRYLSRSQAEADRARLDASEFTLQKVENELRILQQFTKQQKETELHFKLKESIRNLVKTKTVVESKLEQAIIDLDAKTRIYDQEGAKRREILDQIEKCTIRSPQDGLVVYVVPESSRMFGGGSSRQMLIAQGESVFEGQKLMRIPDLDKMQVNVKVHESLISRVKGDQFEQTHFLGRVRTAMLLVPGTLSRLVGQVGYAGIDEKLREEYKQVEHRLKEGGRGQSARIRVYAHPHLVLSGHVKTVATVASNMDYYSSDVKVYQTMVTIDQTVKDLNLKPGMSAEVTILADNTKRKVLTVPIQSVVGTVTMGNKRECFVVDADGRAKKREIEVGMANELMVEVTSGLTEGDKVVLNPKPLLDPKSNLKPGVPGVKRGADGDDDGGGEKKKKGGGKKGAGGPKGGNPPQQNMMLPLAPVLDMAWLGEPPLLVPFSRHGQSRVDALRQTASYHG